MVDKARFEMEHKHVWIKSDDWTEKDKIGRKQHYIAYRCKDPFCTIEKVVLEETTTFEYEIDTSEYWSDGE